MKFRKRAQPKEEPHRPAHRSPEQYMLDALNGMEACIDWRLGNTESNLILNDRKWEIYRRAVHDYDFLPYFNARTQRWEEFPPDE